jgi:deoxyribodipyrimidine photo-lyase
LNANTENSRVLWTPSRLAAAAQLNQFISQNRAGSAYARFRNTDYGPDQHQHVSRLSPYISCRLLLETQALRAVLAAESSTSAEKFIQEICWRTYWKGWLEHNPPVWGRYKSQLEPLRELSQVIRKRHEFAQRAATGIDCFDAWVSELTTTGYLHNHARMWFASIWIFTLQLPWQLGADFFMQHLLDADAAANTLSWRWVAGLQTVGKHYLATADNIARYTDGRFNPRGLLNETAQPLIENAAAPQQTPAQLTNSFIAIPKWQENVISSGILLLHDADLTPEHELGLERLDALVWVAPKQTEPASPAEQFKRGAMQDAVQRVSQHFNLAANNVIELKQSESLSSLLQQHNALIKLPIFLATLPMGPGKDFLAPQIVQCMRQGYTAFELRRHWDEMAWPHARKGFFGFKAKIPALLNTL